MRESIIRLNYQNPMDVEHIQRYGGFASYHDAAVWTSEMRQQGVMRYVCSWNTGRGRPRDVLCGGWTPKQDNVRHELKATDVCLAFWWALRQIGLTPTFKRGYHVGEFRPDIEMTVCGVTYLIEIDCGTMTRPQIQRRWRRYRKFDPDTGVVIIVAVSNQRKGIDSKERIMDLMEWSKDIHSVALYTTHELLCESPLGLSLWDAESQVMRMLDVPTDKPADKRGDYFEDVPENTAENTATGDATSGD